MIGNGCLATKPTNKAVSCAQIQRVGLLRRYELKNQKGLAQNTPL